MGGQLSSSSSLNSLGSQAQSQHDQSPPNSASEQSLLMCSSSSMSASSSCSVPASTRWNSTAPFIQRNSPNRRSCHSPSNHRLWHNNCQQKSVHLISPPICRREQPDGNANAKTDPHGPQHRYPAFARWGSFTRALPALVRTAGNHPTVAQLKTADQKNKHLPSQSGGCPNMPTYIDPNNNTQKGHMPSQIFLLPPFYEEERMGRRGRTPNLDEVEKKEERRREREADEGEEGEEEEEDGEEEGEEEEGESEGKRRERRWQRSRQFSLKASLRKSGSRLFNGIMRNGYLRNLFADDGGHGAQDGCEQGDGTDEEDGRQRHRHGQQQDVLNNNNGSGRSGDEQNKDGLPSSASQFLRWHQHRKGSASRETAEFQSAMETRAKFRRPYQSGGDSGEIGIVGGGGRGQTTSMLLALAAAEKGRKQPQFGQKIARPLSCPTGNQQLQQLDCNGNRRGGGGGEVAIRRQTTGVIWPPAADELMPAQRKKVIQASSSELMRALGHFVEENCHPDLLGQFEPAQLGNWLRDVDRALILQGWQDVAFINPANLVFLFMLIRDAFARGDSQQLISLRDLHSFVLLCLYISYSYMGNEISYPLKPFITESTNRTLFWSQCVRLIKAHSGQMLRLNSSSTFFLEVFSELKAYCPIHYSKHHSAHDD